MNFAKSSLFFSSAGEDEYKREVTEVFGVQRVLNPGRYLGLPTIWGWSKRDTLDYLKERIQDQIQWWRNRLLNNVDKEVLIKAVVTSVSIYAMSVFQLLTTWCTR